MNPENPINPSKSDQLSNVRGDGEKKNNNRSETLIDIQLAALPKEKTTSSQISLQEKVNKSYQGRKFRSRTPKTEAFDPKAIKRAIAKHTGLDRSLSGPAQVAQWCFDLLYSSPDVLDSDWMIYCTLLQSRKKLKNDIPSELRDQSDTTAALIRLLVSMRKPVLDTGTVSNLVNELATLAFECVKNEDQPKQPLAAAIFVCRATGFAPEELWRSWTVNLKVHGHPSKFFLVPLAKRTRVRWLLGVLSQATPHEHIEDLRRRLNKLVPNKHGVIDYIAARKEPALWPEETLLERISNAFQVDAATMRNALIHAQSKTTNDKIACWMQFYLGQAQKESPFSLEVEWPILVGVVEGYMRDLNDRSIGLEASGLHAALKQFDYDDDKLNLLLNHGLTTERDDDVGTALSQLQEHLKTQSANVQRSTLASFLGEQNAVRVYEGIESLPYAGRFVLGIFRGTAVQWIGRMGAYFLVDNLLVDLIPEHARSYSYLVIWLTDITIRVFVGQHLFLLSRSIPAESRWETAQFLPLAGMVCTTVLGLLMNYPLIAGFIPTIGTAELSRLNALLLATVRTTITRAVRQAFQTVTQSDITRGRSLIYSDGSALTLKDRISVYAIRDLLYIASTLVLSSIASFGMDDVMKKDRPFAESGLSALNEGLDEIWPEVAQWIYQWHHNRKENVVQLRLVDIFTPSMSAEKMLKHFRDHFIARTVYLAPAECFSIGAELAGGGTPAWYALKLLSNLWTGEAGAKRGRTLTYNLDPKSTGVPGGLLTWILSKAGYSDSSIVHEERDVGDLVSEEWRNNAFVKCKAFDKNGCRLIDVAGEIRFRVFPSNDGLRHIAERDWHQWSAFHTFALAVNDNQVRLMLTPDENDTLETLAQRWNDDATTAPTSKRVPDPKLWSKVRVEMRHIICNLKGPGSWSVTAAVSEFTEQSGGPIACAASFSNMQKEHSAVTLVLNGRVFNAWEPRCDQPLLTIQDVPSIAAGLELLFKHVGSDGSNVSVVFAVPKTDGAVVVNLQPAVHDLQGVLTKLQMSPSTAPPVDVSPLPMVPAAKEAEEILKRLRSFYGDPLPSAASTANGTDFESVLNLESAFVLPSKQLPSPQAGWDDIYRHAKNGVTVYMATQTLKYKNSKDLDNQLDLFSAWLGFGAQPHAVGLRIEGATVQHWFLARDPARPGNIVALTFGSGGQAAPAHQIYTGSQLRLEVRRLLGTQFNQSYSLMLRTQYGCENATRRALLPPVGAQIAWNGWQDSSTSQKQLIEAMLRRCDYPTSSSSQASLDHADYVRTCTSAGKPLWTAKSKSFPNALLNHLVIEEGTTVNGKPSPTFWLLAKAHAGRRFFLLSPSRDEVGVDCCDTLSEALSFALMQVLTADSCTIWWSSAATVSTSTSGSSKASSNRPSDTWEQFVDHSRIVALHEQSVSSDVALPALPGNTGGPLQPSTSMSKAGGISARGGAHKTNQIYHGKQTGAWCGVASFNTLCHRLDPAWVTLPYSAYVLWASQPLINMDTERMDLSSTRELIDSFNGYLKVHDKLEYGTAHIKRIGNYVWVDAPAPMDGKGLLLTYQGKQDRKAGAPTSGDHTIALVRDHLDKSIFYIVDSLNQQAEVVKSNKGLETALMRVLEIHAAQQYELFFLIKPKANTLSRLKEFLKALTDKLPSSDDKIEAHSAGKLVSTSMKKPWKVDAAVCVQGYWALKWLVSRQRYFKNLEWLQLAWVHACWGSSLPQVWREVFPNQIEPIKSIDLKQIEDVAQPNALQLSLARNAWLSALPAPNASGSSGLSGGLSKTEKKNKKTKQRDLAALLQSFKDAQDTGLPGTQTLEEALKELQQGKRTSQWVWYVFPQTRRLLPTQLSERFCIPDVATAQAYLDDIELKTRLREAFSILSDALANWKLEAIMGEDDADSVWASATLFNQVTARDKSNAHQDIYRITDQVLNACNNGASHPGTMAIFKSKDSK